eukprot:COSAG04_NODE_655_length_11510_cov_33.080887_5_plen_125_part_00
MFCMLSKIAEENSAALHAVAAREQLRYGGSCRCFLYSLPLRRTLYFHVFMFSKQGFLVPWSKTGGEFGRAACRYAVRSAGAAEVRKEAPSGAFCTACRCGGRLCFPALRAGRPDTPNATEALRP